MTQWKSDATEFRDAVESDEYAEYDLDENGQYTLITDWEGDGLFNPYVVVDPYTTNDVDADESMRQTVVEERTLELLDESELVHVDEAEYDASNSGENADIVHLFGVELA